MDGMSLLDVLRGVMLDPAEQAAYNADPGAYLGQYGYDDVDPADLSEAFGLVADTLPPEVAQAAWQASADHGDAAFGGVTTEYDTQSGVDAGAAPGPGENNGAGEAEPVLSFGYGESDFSETGIDPASSDEAAAGQSDDLPDDLGADGTFGEEAAVTSGPEADGGDTDAGVDDAGDLGDDDLGDDDLGGSDLGGGGLGNGELGDDGLGELDGVGPGLDGVGGDTGEIDALDDLDDLGGAPDGSDIGSF
jgi:hypothetical protein